MNSNQSQGRSLADVGRVLALVAVAALAVVTVQLVASWLAPIVAVPLLVAGWVVGLGLAIFLPFAIVVVVAGMLAR